MIKGVMFDFSGTLFRIDSTERWLDGHLAAASAAASADTGLAGDVVLGEVVLGEADRAELVARLEEFGALPGGVPPRTIPAELVEAWGIRDLSAAEHRAAYTGLTRAALAHDSLAHLAEPLAGLDVDALYERHMSPDAWQPYADAEPVLRELRHRGLPVAIVSNIGWDLRPIFHRHGLDEWVDAYVLSYEVGAQKPEPTIFQEACNLLGLAPADVLMVGDDLAADGGAAALGSIFHQVDHLPVDQRPDGLRPLLALLD